MVPGDEALARVRARTVTQWIHPGAEAELGDAAVTTQHTPASYR